MDVYYQQINFLGCGCTYYVYDCSKIKRIFNLRPLQLAQNFRQTIRKYGRSTIVLPSKNHSKDIPFVALQHNLVAILIHQKNVLIAYQKSFQHFSGPKSLVEKIVKKLSGITEGTTVFSTDAELSIKRLTTDSTQFRESESWLFIGIINVFSENRLFEKTESLD